MDRGQCSQLLIPHVSVVVCASSSSPRVGRVGVGGGLCHLPTVSHSGREAVREPTLTETERLLRARCCSLPGTSPLHRPPACETDDRTVLTGGLRSRDAGRWVTYPVSQE